MSLFDVSYNVGDWALNISVSLRLPCDPRHVQVPGMFTSQAVLRIRNIFDY